MRNFCEILVEKNKNEKITAKNYTMQHTYKFD